MVDDSTVDAVVGSVSVANRPDNSLRREIDGVQAIKAVTKRDPRRTCGISPDSRLNRRRLTRPASSHWQERELTMSEALFVGIDVAKDSFCVASRPEGIRISLPNNAKGHRDLVCWNPTW